MEAAALRVCPGCSSRMGRVFARAIELDFCQFCGGVWFDRGEVLAVTGHEEALGEGGPRHLKCPDCLTPMRRGKLSGCAVEQCERCTGTYVPPGTLEQLAGEQLRMLPFPDDRRHEALEFRCGGCGDRLPLEQGLTTSHGMSCRNCYGRMDDLSGSGILAPGPVAVEYLGVDALTDLEPPSLGSATFDPLALMESPPLREATPLQKMTEVTVTLAAFVARLFLPFP